MRESPQHILESSQQSKPGAAANALQYPVQRTHSPIHASAEAAAYAWLPPQLVSEQLCCIDVERLSVMPSTVVELMGAAAALLAAGASCANPAATHTH